MNKSYITPQALASALEMRDLTDETAGPHAIQTIASRLIDALSSPEKETITWRGTRIVSEWDNYDCLGYRPDAVTRATRYSRYTAPGQLLRTQMSAAIPGALRHIAGWTDRATKPVLIAAPGMVYRRDVIDKWHTGEPHQIDLWETGARTYGKADLLEMAGKVAETILPGREWRTTPAEHPYTTGGLQ